MNIDMIEAAAKRLDGHARRTPLLSSPLLDEIAGRRILVKAECLQHTGAFKFRGAWSAISAMEPEKRAGGVITFSAGNHAQGVAFAAREHGIDAVIVMPKDAPQLKINNTRAYGAEVVLYDRVHDDRAAISAQLAAARGLHMIQPYDDQFVVAGQGTVGLEIASQAAAMAVSDAAVLVPFGGGGLTCGIALALAARAPNMRVHPVEPVGFDDMARSLISGKREDNAQKSGSICDAILTPTPGETLFPIVKNLCGPGLVVSDDDCLRAMAAAFYHLKLVTEPGGAIALAAALWHADKIDSDTVIVIISGGNVDADMFKSALQTDG